MRTNGSTQSRRFDDAAEHQRIAVVESPDAARHAAIDEMHAGGRERGRAPLRVLVVRVAAVDDHVAARELGPDVLDRELGRAYPPAPSARRCAAHASACTSSGSERAAGSIDSFRGQRIACLGIRIEPDHTHARARKTPCHVAAHPPESDDADFHRCTAGERRDATGSRPRHRVRYCSARREASSAATRMNAPPVSVRKSGYSPSSHAASAMP